MTKEENAYAVALNLFGCDPESPEEHDILHGLYARSHHDPAVPAVRSTNWPATLAAVAARGPRCDDCGEWTFRPQLTGSRWPATCAECDGAALVIPAPEGWIR